MLELVADFAELSRNRPVDQERHTELLVHSPKEHFHTYLQSLDAERAGLPDEFRDKLARVLRHYGVTDFERTPQLEEAVFRIFLAQQRSAPEIKLATSILQRWLGEPAPGEQEGAAARDALDRLVVATQLRFPVVGDLARSVRFRWFDQPLVDQERASVLDGVSDRLAALAAEPDAPDHAAAGRRARLDPRADRALPRRPAARGARGGLPEHEPMLEVLIRRHYREHELHGLHTFSRGRPALRRRPTTPSMTGPPTSRRRSVRPRSSRRAAPSTRPSRPTSGPGPRATTPSSTSTSAGRRSRSRPTRRATSSPGCCRRCPSPGRPVGSRSRRAPAGVGRSPTSPSVPARAASSRTASYVGCTRWSAAGSTSGA